MSLIEMERRRKEREWREGDGRFNEKETVEQTAGTGEWKMKGKGWGFLCRWMDGWIFATGVFDLETWSINQIKSQISPV